jgi:cysteine desulfurase
MENTKKLIYLDNAATTQVDEQVFEAMKPYFCELYANPSSVYSFAGKASKAVEEAREQIASLLHAKA